MRKTNKIVSLVLVLALLLGVFVVLPATPVVANAAGDETFESTADEKHRPSSTDVKNATAVGDNVTYSGANNCTDETADHWLVTDKATGNQYVDFRPGKSFTDGTTHNHWNWYYRSGGKLEDGDYYEAGKYLLVEMDVFVEYEVLTDAYICLMTRNSDGGPYGASVFIKDMGVSVGEWAHITIIGDYLTNKAYFFANGKWVRTADNGVANNGNIKTDPASFGFDGLRLNVNTRTTMNANQNVAIDNIKFTVNVESAWLTANLAAAKSLVGSDVYSTAYALPSVPAVAKVDGQPVGSVAQLNKALLSHKAVEVELLRSYCGIITVNCDATVKTNGSSRPEPPRLGSA